MKFEVFDFEDINAAIKDSSQESSIYVACDSAEKGRFITFVTVVVIHFDSCHGGRIFYDVQQQNIKMRMRDKLLAEVYKSVETALLISDTCGNRKLQVHLDLNPDPNEGSYICHKEGLSYVKAFGLDAVAKHTSWASYCCADMLAKHFSKKKNRRSKS